MASADSCTVTTDPMYFYLPVFSTETGDISVRTCRVISSLELGILPQVTESYYEKQIVEYVD